MGRMRVKLDGKGAFTWAASERNVSKLERDVRAAATAIMADPKAISAAAVDEVLTNGLDLDGLKRQRQATAISITCFSGKRARTSGQARFATMLRRGILSSTSGAGQTAA